MKGLFLLAKAMAADLENAARAGGACLIAATAHGGSLRQRRLRRTPISSPATEGSPDWSRRWPENGLPFASRVVDFAADDPIETVADRLAAEVFVSDGWAEVGYDQGRRIRCRRSRARSSTRRRRSS